MMIMVDDIKTTIDANDDSKDGLSGALAPDAQPTVPEEAIVLGPAPVPGQTPTMDASPAAAPDNETEFERIQRLKLNTDDAPHSGVMNDDIQKILKDAKLPERRDFKAAGDARLKGIATMPTEASAIPPKGAEAASAVADEKPKERDIVTALHTLKDDMQDIVRRRKISLVRASALEQDKKREAPVAPVQNPAAAQRTRRTFAFVFAALLLIGLAGAALYGVAVVMNNRTAAPAQQYPSLIFAEAVVTLPIDNTAPESIKQTIAQARTQSNAPIGSITRIIPTIATTTASSGSGTQPATVAQFFGALGLQAPSGLVRGLGSTFFFGLHTVDINAPVFVIPVTSYDLAFAGMLAWEPTMDQDLAPAFDAVPALETGPDGLPKARTFSDAVMLNYDVRELKDDSGNVVLYYSFPTPNILVIAESPSTFTEVLSRLRAQREL
jgi:hypothetical protein